MRALTFLARKFVAGETAEEALSVIRRLNGHGLKATLDFLGEDVSSESQAEGGTREIERLFELIKRAKLDCNVSIKLTQLGLNLDPAAISDPALLLRSLVDAFDAVCAPVAR